jgi:hypothetical protein
VCTAEWRHKPTSTMSNATAAVIGAGASRDGSDPSYQRPLVIDPPS